MGSYMDYSRGYSTTSIILAGQITYSDSRGRGKLKGLRSLCFFFIALWEKKCGPFFVLPYFSFLSVSTIKISSIIFSFLYSDYDFYEYFFLETHLEIQHTSVIGFQPQQWFIYLSFSFFKDLLDLKVILNHCTFWKSYFTVGF